MDESRTPEEARAAEAVRDLPEPSARGDFRARLRAEFVSGEIAARARRRRAEVIPLVVRGGAVLALAAALAGVFLTIRDQPKWRVAAAPAAGEIRVGERTFAAVDAGVWERALRAGMAVEWTGEAPLRLVMSKRLAIEAMPDARFTLPGPPGGRTGAIAELTVERGAVQFATGPEFEGGRLLVHTAPTDVEVVGTTFAVLCMPDFTCVCVGEGVVRVVPRGGESMELPAGERGVVHDDGRVERYDTVEPAEAPALERFRAEAGALLGRGGNR